MKPEQFLSMIKFQRDHYLNIIEIEKSFNSPTRSYLISAKQAHLIILGLYETLVLDFRL